MARTSRDDNSAPRWIWALLCLGLLGAAGGAYWALSRPDAAAESGPEPAPAPLVQTVTVEAATAITLRQTGFIRAAEQVDVVPQITERIVTVGPLFEVGQILDEGDLLVAFNDTQFAADLAEAQARFDQAQAALQETRLTLTRQQELAESDFASEAALDDAQVAMAQAEANLAMSRAALQRATSAREDTTISAPFDAIVTAQTASPGQFVSAGTPIGHLVATDHVDVEFALLPQDIAALGRAEAAIGLNVAISDPVTARALGSGTVTGVVPVIGAQTRTTDLLVRIDAPFAPLANGATLRVGELVAMSLSVPLDETRAVRLPAEAVKGNATVWRVEAGQLDRLSVEVIARNDTHIIVTHPELADGDSVLLSDLVAPTQGQQIRVADQPDTDAPTAQGG